MRRSIAVLAVLLGIAALAGCAGSPTDAGSQLRSHVVVDNPQLRKAKAAVGVADCPKTQGVHSRLPDLTLPCLGGGRSVNLSHLHGPAVIGLWASWCVYCPKELPFYQRLSRAAGHRLTVLGVDYQDTSPPAALALLRRSHATYPQLADPGGDLANHYRVSGLPGMLLVDAHGRVTFRLQQVGSYAQLAGLVAAHTGVDVRAG